MSGQHTDKPILFLLEPAFEDTNYPGQRFFCRHCQLIEGLLASFPKLRDKLEVRHTGFPRPRDTVVALVGEQNQSLPKLVLPAGAHSAHAEGEHAGCQYVSGSDAILATLADLYGIPVAHP
jgi:hypothetical protein